MEYEFKEYIRDEILSNINHMNILDDALDELDHVYTRAQKVDELQTINGILLGEMDTLKINLNHYKKQSDQYEEISQELNTLRKFHGIVWDSRMVSSDTVYEWNQQAKRESGESE